MNHAPEILSKIFRDFFAFRYTRNEMKLDYYDQRASV